MSGVLRTLAAVGLLRPEAATAAAALATKGSTRYIRSVVAGDQHSGKTNRDPFRHTVSYRH